MQESNPEITRDWTAREEETIARIMADENLVRIDAIQAMQRRKKAGQSLSHRVKLDDPFQSSARCQNRRCLECTLTSGDTDAEMTAFLDIMLNGKQQSGEYFLVQRDPSRKTITTEMPLYASVAGEFPVSARTDDSVDGMVPKEPYEPALELTEAGIVEGQVYVWRAKSTTVEENTPSGRTEAISALNVDGLSPLSAQVTSGPVPSQSAIKRYAGRQRISEQEKRVTAAQRQARWRKRRQEQDR